MSETKNDKIKKRFSQSLPLMEGPACGGIRPDSGEGVTLQS